MARYQPNNEQDNDDDDVDDEDDDDDDDDDDDNDDSDNSWATDKTERKIIAVSCLFAHHPKSLPFPAP